MLILNDYMHTIWLEPSLLHEQNQTQGTGVATQIHAVNAPRGKPRGITVDLKVEHKLRLPRIFLSLTFDVLLNNFFVNSYCRYKIPI